MTRPRPEPDPGPRRLPPDPPRRHRFRKRGFSPAAGFSPWALAGLGAYASTLMPSRIGPLTLPPTAGARSNPSCSISPSACPLRTLAPGVGRPSGCWDQPLLFPRPGLPARADVGARQGRGNTRSAPGMDPGGPCSIGWSRIRSISAPSTPHRGLETWAQTPRGPWPRMIALVGKTGRGPTPPKP
jgi:hypothetical protein